ncbi:uncharacterized protein N7483_011174 [Penicillium malachiteum]|uniref:uncharacterized protein n=1 Tax=Penicillium malachiteum TaxID=1324776 RepID=UPI00254701FB|nr:uncharacterized protein N7483_011174 [Penicillium malachiteum]KAJ5713993.1 hypothetical protein N7483_011174 [Penicillium malachiteum]
MVIFAKRSWLHHRRIIWWDFEEPSIGKATVLSFSRHGVRQLSLADINLDAAQQVAHDIKSHFPGINAIARRIDFTSESSINTAISDTVKQLGRIDYAVNSAGIAGPPVLSAEHELEGWKSTLDIDLTGVWSTSWAEIRAMLKQRKYEEFTASRRHNLGVIINVASMYGIIGTSLNVPVVSYTAAKHGVVGLTQADAIAYAPQDIRINAICPGYVRTPLVGSSMHTEIMQREGAKVPVKRIVDMDEIADHITFLASPMSSYMYGSALVADG